MTKQILAYGDSLTWDTNPASAGIADILKRPDLL